jgi:hypothetical protein
MRKDSRTREAWYTPIFIESFGQLGSCDGRLEAEQSFTPSSCLLATLLPVNELTKGLLRISGLHQIHLLYYRADHVMNCAQ